MTIKKIKLSYIKGDLSLQGREQLHPELIKEYAETVDELPPIDLYVESTSDGDVFYIGNGWHRFMAHERAGRTEISANVHLGGREAALLHACRANTAAEHGRTRSNADKHKAVKLYMTHSDWFKHGNNRIAEACKVDPKTVQEIRLRLQAQGMIPEVTEREGKDGKTQSASKKRLSISTPTESSRRVMSAFDQAEAAQVGKSIPEREASSPFTSSYEGKKQEDPPSAPPQKLSPQEVSKAEAKASEEPEEEGSYQHHNTPSWIRDLFEPMGGIALDPCSNQWSVMQARKAFTVEDDGLAQDWVEASLGGMIFVNPPYKAIAPWVAKIEQEAKRGAEMALLVPTSHGTQWWQKAARSCSVMALFNSRVAFTKEGKKNGSPQWETLIFYWGERAELFCRSMEHVAFLVREIPRQVYRGIYAKDDPRQEVLPVIAKPQTATVEAPKEEKTLDEHQPTKEFLCISCNKSYPEASGWTTHREVIHREPGPRATWTLLVETEGQPAREVETSAGDYTELEIRAALSIHPASRLWLTNIAGAEPRFIESEVKAGYAAELAGQRALLISGKEPPQKYAYGCLVCGNDTSHLSAQIDQATGEILCPNCAKPKTDLVPAPTERKEESTKPKQNAKKRGHKEAEVSCLSCQNTTTLATSRSLNGHHICAACFEKFPPSTMVKVKAFLKEGHGAELLRFGKTLTREERSFEMTSAEASALAADKRLSLDLDELVTRGASTPLYETPDYFLALLRDAKDDDAIKNAQELADAYLPSEVAQQHAEALRAAASDRRELLRKKEEKASAPKRARAR